MVLMKKVNNANAGDADHVGGNDWDKLADYFNDIDTAEVPRINNPTEYRSGILKIRDGTNVFNVTVKSATQTANRDFTIPPLIGNDSPATLALANNFTALQTISLDTDTLLSLYRPVSTTDALCGLGFYERNSSNVSVPYSAIYNRLVVNTAGDEDGKLVFYVRKDGVLTEVGSIDKNGLLTIGSVSTGGGTPAAILANANVFTGAPQTISNNSAVLARLYRPATTATNLVGLDFQHQNASTTQTTYGRISTELVTNTAADEDGKMHFYVMKDGTLTDVMNVDKNGLLTVASVSSGGGGGTSPTVLLNTGAAVTTASTSAEFDMVNYSVAGNTLGANGALRVRVSGYAICNAGASDTFSIAVKFGTTTMYAGSTAAVPQSASQRPFLIELVLGNKNATNIQGLSGSFMLQDTNATTTGNGDIADDEMVTNANFRGVDGAKDTTSAQTLQVTMTMSSSSASMSTSVQRRIIEFIPGA